MFSLIITIISIALVAALALATLYYGGDAFNEGRAAAHASMLINQAQQIEGAWHLARANGDAFATLTDVTGDNVAVAELVSAGYLSTQPQFFEGRALSRVDGRVVIATGPTDGSNAEFELAVCNELQRKAGGPVATEYANLPAGWVEFMATGQKFGCHQDEGTLVRFVLQ